MSWRTIALADVRDAGRSRTVWLLSGLLSVLFVGYAVGHGWVGTGSFPAFVGGLAGIVGALLPVLALLLGYRSIHDARVDGSILLTLALPHSRRDLLVGTLVGRAVVLLVPTLVALALAGVVGAVQYGTESAVWYLWVLAAAALYGLAFLGVALGLSVTATTDRRVTYGAVGGYLLLVVFWQNLTAFTVSVLHRFDPSIATPDWSLFAQLLEPRESFRRLVAVGFDAGGAGKYLGSDAPLYVDWWAALLVLVVWFAVPVALGYHRFRDSDL